ncbi:MAG: tRNA (N6-threonylcarbamoyladenosine(37)-N6)-methyltransferase TrmO [Acidobacteria bacterium]|nr:tRNA (N6-threonylcarbamoyladenosine(37)-N6)-methyltransferase TrmO [Acidobacteriota bacterium]
MSSESKTGNSIALRPIGIIHSPFSEAAGTPIQPVYGSGVEGTVQVDGEFTEALDDIEGFERIWLIYLMDRTGPFKPKVMPYRDNVEHGLFATRSPNRPNPIGLSVVRLLRREGSTLFISDMDVLDGTPLLEIKPYVPEFDCYPNSRAGWFDKAAVDRRMADGRFHNMDAAKS